MSPELSLTLLHGAPMTYPKSHRDGRTERTRVLAAVFGEDVIEQHIRRPPRGARVDDVLDAFAGAWTARRFAAREHLHLGGDRDARGLRMEVVA